MAYPSRNEIVISLLLVDNEDYITIAKKQETYSITGKTNYFYLVPVR